MNDPQNIYAEIGEPVKQFIRHGQEKEFTELLKKYPREKRSFWLDWKELFRWESNVADDFLVAHDTFSTVFRWAIEEMPNPINADLEGVDIRLTNLPESRTFDVGQPRSDQVNEYIGVRGQISKVGRAKLKPETVVFECQRCGTHTEVTQGDVGFTEPHECGGCDRQGPFSVDWDRTGFKDHVKIQLQQPPEDVAMGNSETITVAVSDELERWFNDRDLSAGARITANGFYRIDEASERNGSFDSYLDAVSIEVEEQDYEEIDTSEHKDEIEALAADPDVYTKLTDSLAPDIKGGEKMRLIKLGLILQMFGGYRRVKPDGTAMRGDTHLLILGDPGTGKSSLLDAVQEISPRAMKTSGKGASAAGMTAAAVPDTDFGDGKYTLEAGALALSNKGIACVDEIDKMRDDAVESMHDALETQTINVNKAGINATIPAQTSLLAAGNPKYDRFDEYEPISEQIELDGALLSRFDLWFMLRDEPDEDRDETIAEEKVDVWRESAAFDQGEIAADDATSIAPEIDYDTLRAYIAYARRNVAPKIGDEAGEKIIDYYRRIRSHGDDETVPLTARKLEGLRRLSEASAKVRLSDTVEPEDVQRAIDVIGQSLADVGIDPESGEMDADIVETGRSKTQRDRVKSIKEIIRELQNEYNEAPGAPTAEVLERAVESGIEERRAEHEIQKLRDKGEILSPDQDHVREV